MDISQIFQTLSALLFVLGLLFITLWLIKYAQLKGLSCHFGNHQKSKAKIKIMERQRIDVKNSMLLLQYDNEEFLLLLGPQNNLLLKQTSLKKESSAK